MPSLLNYETPITESKKHTVRDTYRSLEVKVNLLKIEIIAMKSFIEDQMLILWQSRKDLALQKSSCDHNSKVARLIEEIAYLRNENRTKSCIIQTLLDNDNTQEQPPDLIRLTSKYQINMCDALKITHQMMRMYLHLINAKNYQIMVILKRSAILGLCKIDESCRLKQNQFR